eukprot:TRINITY_DN5246_c0_g2_i1.p1 TRINITY_DN5246_c0_g2~~TRINITY_DN5246_c0_g2_i1.p1  ORF type:complete len:545 (+),score=93.21 TRINITY_DN5246_c0_g2_i1:67-1701(+)
MVSASRLFAAEIEVEDDWILIDESSAKGFRKASLQAQARKAPTAREQNCDADREIQLRKHICGPRTAKLPIGPRAESPVTRFESPGDDGQDAGMQVFSLSPRATAEVNDADGWVLTGDFVDRTRPSIIGRMKQESHGLSGGRSREAAEDTGTFEDCVMVPQTSFSQMRHLAQARPRVAQCLLWCAFALMLAGELATTGWWIWSMGIHGVCFLLAAVILSFSLAFQLLGPGQFSFMSISVVFAAMPALPAYSAVLLLVPSNDPTDSVGHDWDWLHWPSLVALAAMYFVQAVLLALREETHRDIGLVIAALEQGQRIARGTCLLAAWVTLASLLHVGVVRLRASGQPCEQCSAGMSSPLTSERGLVVSLHVCGVLCAELRQRLLSALGSDLLPVLLGAERAKALDLRTLALRYARKLLGRLPALRRCTPPAAVVATILAVRRTAPVLFPILALSTQLPSRCAALLLVALLALLAAVAARERRALPRSPLRQLPLLLPRCLVPCSRKGLGYVLAVADSMGSAFRCSGSAVLCQGLALASRTRRQKNL